MFLFYGSTIGNAWEAYRCRGLLRLGVLIGMFVTDRTNISATNFMDSEDAATAQLLSIITMSSREIMGDDPNRRPRAAIQAKNEGAQVQEDGQLQP